MPSNNPAETLVADIRTGGASRRHAFDLIEQEFGSQFRSGGNVAAESYIEALNIVRRADPARAAVEFTERFIDMLDMAAKELLISRLYVEEVTNTLAKKEPELIECESALSSKTSWFRGIFR
jgi:hypothetical protein